MSRFLKSTLGKITISSGALVGATIVYLDFIKPAYPSNLVDTYSPLKKPLVKAPTRSQLLDNLSSTKKFDVIIIGGGAVGTGTAVDAATRGLNVCLLEKTDFAAGTSSKSTKMAHGGVRYLEKAIFQLSKAQLDLVIEALNERGNMLRTAPHLCSVLPIMIPVYKWWQVPYFFVGCKMYDWFAGYQNLRTSTIFSREYTNAVAPMIDDANLKATCVYHDGSFNDARYNATLAVTAIENGATVLNYFNVEQLLKDSQGKLIGVKAQDLETGKSYTINATSVVNATGPFADAILEMDEDAQGLPPKTAIPPRMVVPSSGVHIVLPEYYCPKDIGLLDPATSDGRVMFFLPWQGKVLAGTTDHALKSVPENPVATEQDIEDILKELQKYLVFKVSKDDVLSAWCGIRPLVRDPKNIPKGADLTGATEGIVRSHLITKTDSDLITISGGKWTTYREMAQETVDTLLKNFQFDNASSLKPCQTNEILLAGGEDYSKNYISRLIHEYNIPYKLAHHLSTNYGSRAPLVLDLYFQSDFNKLPITLAHDKVIKPSTTSNTGNFDLYQSADEPFTVAELKYSIHHEYARTPLDFLARRTRLAFLNAKEALAAIDGVSEIMKSELKWSDATTKKLKADAIEYISQMTPISVAKEKAIVEASTAIDNGTTVTTVVA
ncbi:mitochondrial glycerol-3-phosphate dehydrogenase [Scheffersomyces amazonensis]|uniref:mitochondrial glycerol-3-phosphate dehydrogenase n=1 Tax=Scheffersomyces amazonensis TaxID=1078765 RepID=UPI00315D7019